MLLKQGFTLLHLHVEISCTAFLSGSGSVAAVVADVETGLCASIFGFFLGRNARELDTLG